MLSFFKKKYVPQRGPVLTVDLHSHFIPGIDDGSQNMEESLTLLRGMADLGYKKVITTPHIMVDAYKNTPEIITSGLEDVRQAIVQAGIEIEIDAAAEYYLDDGFLLLLEKGNLMPVNDEYLLFETSYISKPLQLEEMIFEIGAAGYTPLMAHPERYRYIRNPEKEYTRLKDLGVKFQVNLNSFGGHYGKSAQTLVSFIKEKGMIDFLGSDVHHKKQVETLSEVFVSEAYNDIFSKNKILNHFL
jgi:tyrosine-protein phosphatase YwqE